MPANDEFPRGWTFTGNASGTALEFILPATPGISHVVTDIYAAAVGNAGAAAGGFFGLVMAGLSLRNIFAGGQNTINEETWSGKFAGAPGAAVSIAVGQTAASYGFVLTVSWYDI